MSTDVTVVTATGSVAVTVNSFVANDVGANVVVGVTIVVPSEVLS